MGFGGHGSDDEVSARDVELDVKLPDLTTEPWDMYIYTESLFSTAATSVVRLRARHEHMAEHMLTKRGCRMRLRR